MKNIDKLYHRISLAPMVRMNTTPFRLLTKKYGGDFIFSEEIIDKKFLFCQRIENELLNTIDYVNTKDYGLILRLKREEKEHFILQIGTNNAESAVQAVYKTLPDIRGVDVNMGCPKKFSVHGGMGSALMRDVENAQIIMKSLVEHFKGKITVSCKIRVLNNFEDSLAYVLAMQETGIDWISIHPRTAAEECRVPARWFMTKRIIENDQVRIPVYGSGDLFTPHDIQKYLRFTGAAGVIIARGAIHYPAIYSEKNTMLDQYEQRLNEQEIEEWAENMILPPVDDKSKFPIEEQKQSKNGKKKVNNDEESIEFSQNLVKVFDRHYSRQEPMKMDILELIREYFKMAIETGNNFQNTKYCILYMLKTHKQYFELFKKLQLGKGLFEYAKILELEHLVQDLDKNLLMHIEYTFYRKNKHIVDELERKSQQEKELNVQLSQSQVGAKRQSQERDSEMNEQNQIQDSDKEIDQQTKRIKTQ